MIQICTFYRLLKLLAGRSPLDTLHGIGALETKLCFYSLDTEDADAEIVPATIPRHPSRVNDTASADRWNFDVLEAEAEQKLRDIVEEITVECAALEYQANWASPTWTRILILSSGMMPLLTRTAFDVMSKAALLLSFGIELCHCQLKHRYPQPHSRSTYRLLHSAWPRMCFLRRWPVIVTIKISLVMLLSLRPFVSKHPPPTISYTNGDSNCSPGYFPLSHSI